MLYGLKDMSQARGDMKLLVGQEFYLFLIYYFLVGACCNYMEIITVIKTLLCLDINHRCKLTTGQLVVEALKGKTCDDESFYLWSLF